MLCTIHETSPVNRLYILKCVLDLKYKCSFSFWSVTSWPVYRAKSQTGSKYRHFFYLCFLSECNAAIHKKCIDKIIGRCTGTAANSRDTVVRITYLCSTPCTVSFLHMSWNFLLVWAFFTFVLAVVKVFLLNIINNGQITELAGVAESEFNTKAFASQDLHPIRYCL